MTNEVIRRKAAAEKVHLWEVARRMGMADTTFSKRMREQFSDEETVKVLRMIDQIAEEKREEISAS